MEDEPSPVIDVVAYEVASMEVNQTESKNDGPAKRVSPSLNMKEPPALPQRAQPAEPPVTADIARELDLGTHGIK